MSFTYQHPYFRILNSELVGIFRENITVTSLIFFGNAVLYILLLLLRKDRIKVKLKVKTSSSQKGLHQITGFGESAYDRCDTLPTRNHTPLAFITKLLKNSNSQISILRLSCIKNPSNPHRFSERNLLKRRMAISDHQTLFFKACF